MFIEHSLGGLIIKNVGVILARNPSVLSSPQVLVWADHGKYLQRYSVVHGWDHLSWNATSRKRGCGVWCVACSGNGTRYNVTRVPEKELGLMGSGRPNSPLNSVESITEAIARSPASLARARKDQGEASLTSSVDCHSISFRRKAGIAHKMGPPTSMRLLKMYSNGYHGHQTISGY